MLKPKMSIAKRPIVKSVQMHENTFLTLPGKGKKVEKTVNADTLRGVQMERTASGILCSLGAELFEFPATACKLIQYEVDDSKEEKSDEGSKENQGKPSGPKA